MVKIQNTLKTDLAIIGFKKFTPSEKREVTKEIAKILLKNPFIEIVKPGLTKKSKEEIKKAKEV